METQKELEEQWIACKDELKLRMPAPLFRSLISPIRLDPDLTSKENNSIILRVSDDQMRNHIQKTYLSTIKEILSKKSFQGQVSILAKPSSSGGSKSSEVAPLLEVPEGFPGQKSTPGKDSKSEYFVEPYLEGFFHSLKTLSNSAGVVFIQGETGCGKTALIDELKRSWDAANISSSIFSMEEFLTGFSTSIQKKKVLEWRSRLRSSRVVVIDDFQFMKSSASRSQEEIRSMIDEFHHRDAILILLSDTPLSRLSLSSGLKSRLSAAESVVLNGPDLAARIKILQNEAELRGLKLPESLIQHLAENIFPDGRKLRSAIVRISQPDLSEQISEFQSRAIRECSDLFNQKSDISPEEVLDRVARYFRITPEGIAGPARDKKYSLGRHLVAYILTEFMGFKLSDAAKVIGRKDHATVIHARQKIEKLMNEDLYFRREVESIVHDLRWKT